MGETDKEPISKANWVTCDNSAMAAEKRKRRILLREVLASFLNEGASEQGLRDGEMRLGRGEKRRRF